MWINVYFHGLQYTAVVLGMDPTCRVWWPNTAGDLVWTVLQTVLEDADQVDIPAGTLTAGRYVNEIAAGTK